MAERLTWARQKKELTINELSALSGISLTTLSKMENNRCRNHDVKVIKRLAEALDQPIWFIGSYDLLPKNSLGEQIRKMRLYKGQYIQELADELGIDPHLVSRYEKGIAMPSARIRIHINFLTL
ncbi:MAG: helix-turn-helix domain protein [Firmicutes bacterium]|nr:helix-turn-helix domain protein [Bacillota bacterium]